MIEILPLFTDIVVEPFPHFSIIATMGAALVVFLIFGAILAIPLFRGRKINRKCACAASKEALRVLEERERAAKEARLYSPSTVDVKNLPQTSAELAEYSVSRKRGS